jgi:DeoR/GlpR family transcriptional regulator of sugar metabolism
MLGPTRKNQMAQYIKLHSSATVRELSRKFNVSPMTVRRDLEELEANNMIARTHGGAMALEAPTPARDEIRSTLYTEQKSAIGAAAAQIVQDGQTVFVDAGSTTIELAKRLVDHSRLTVVTNYLRVLTLFADIPGIDVIGLGGSVFSPAWDFIGPIAEATLARFHCDIAFLGIRNLSLERGLTEANQFEASIKTLIIKQSQRVVLLADSSKFEKISPVHVADLSELDVIITDTRLPEELANAYRKSGPELWLAGD